MTLAQTQATPSLPQARISCSTSWRALDLTGKASIPQFPNQPPPRYSGIGKSSNNARTNGTGGEPNESAVS